MSAMIRAIRGATTVDADTKEEVFARTQALLVEITKRNGIADEDLVSMHFTVTPDITSAFPATAARELGYVDVPLIGSVEAMVNGAPKLCVRVMVYAMSELSRAAISHVYQNGATVLRADLAD